ncbi:MAG: hypothetical protein UX43_C0001G0104, partial [Candidatus Giovannonibacteria bacterium GW2011_GWB1_46_20]
MHSSPELIVCNCLFAGNDNMNCTGDI